MPFHSAPSAGHATTNARLQVAILDVSEDEMKDAEEDLKAIIFGKRHENSRGAAVEAIFCNVASAEDCAAAAGAVAKAFPGSPISFLLTTHT